MAGAIEVIVGEMYCGKTEELIRRAKRAKIAKQQVQVFKPIIDKRYSETDVSTHYRLIHEAQPVTCAREILDKISPFTQVVCIDEAQFFDRDIVSVSELLADDFELKVILAGLGTDFRGETFGHMGDLLAHADKITRLNAVCIVCGEEATHTHRLPTGSVDNPIILIGGENVYEARCRAHREHHKQPV